MNKTVEQEDVLYRAAELARSGQFGNWNGIAEELRREGYSQVDEAFADLSARDQIDLACGAARNP